MGRTYPPAIAALLKFRRTTAMALALAFVGMTSNGLNAQSTGQAPATEARMVTRGDSDSVTREDKGVGKGGDS